MLDEAMCQFIGVAARDGVKEQQLERIDIVHVLQPVLQKAVP